MGILLGERAGDAHAAGQSLSAEHERGAASHAGRGAGVSRLVGRRQRHRQSAGGNDELEQGDHGELHQAAGGCRARAIRNC